MVLLKKLQRVSISIRKGERQVILNILMLTRASESQDYIIATRLWFLESKKVILAKLKLLKLLVKPYLKVQQKMILRRSEA